MPATDYESNEAGKSTPATSQMLLLRWCCCLCLLHQKMWQPTRHNSFVFQALVWPIKWWGSLVIVPTWHHNETQVSNLQIEICSCQHLAWKTKQSQSGGETQQLVNDEASQSSFYTHPSTDLTVKGGHRRARGFVVGLNWDMSIKTCHKYV